MLGLSVPGQTLLILFTTVQLIQLNCIDTTLLHVMKFNVIKISGHEIDQIKLHNIPLNCAIDAKYFV